MLSHPIIVHNSFPLHVQAKSLCAVILMKNPSAFRPQRTEVVMSRLGKPSVPPASFIRLSEKMKPVLAVYFKYSQTNPHPLQHVLLEIEASVILTVENTAKNTAHVEIYKHGGVCHYVIVT